MTTISITIQDIKEIKNLMNEVDQLKDGSCNYGDDLNPTNYAGKESLIDFKESKIEKNIEIISKLLDVSYNCVVDMCYDFDFAQEVLNDIYTPAN